MNIEKFEASLPELPDKERRRLEEVLSDLHHLLTNSYQKSTNAFAEDIIEFLAQFSGCAVASFWDADPESKHLVFTGGFAVHPEQLPQTKIPESTDSAYRQVMREHEVIFAKNLEGLFLQTGTYAIPLRSWLVFPVLLNERLVAALEFYHPSGFSSLALHFLLRTLMPIAAAWSGVREHEHRRALIERLKAQARELHKQKEEIQAHEEELRQQTEELEAINENLEGAKRLVEQKNIAMQETMQELEKTKQAVENKNKNIMAGIQYARRIQKAMLPSKEMLQKALGEFALFFAPRDVVSGDFYWMTQTARGTWVAAVDCTGHGVPAALMGMMGLNLLEHTVKSDEAICPAKVLTQLDASVHSLLRQDETGTNDGMDMGICLLEKRKNTILYAGAMNSAYYFSTKGMQRLKHDRMAIGGGRSYRTAAEFTPQKVEMTSSGMLYMCSDGFQDQFGGPKNRKFMRKHFMQLLSEIWQMPAEEQNKILAQRFKDWKSSYPQTDDVLVLGIRC